MIYFSSEFFGSFGKMVFQTFYIFLRTRLILEVVKVMHVPIRE